MRAIPAYLSDSDACSISDFTTSELSDRYVINTQNLYWSGTVNPNHVFDQFSEYLTHQSGTQTRLDMLRHISENNEKYSLISVVTLKIHELDLDTWKDRMSYVENSADELALFALSDLTKRHTIVLTRTKPWSTVHPDVVVTGPQQLMELCDVRLLFLGGNKYARIRPRPVNYTSTVIVNQTVFPKLDPHSDRELDTAYSLLQMKCANMPAANLDLREPTVDPYTASLETTYDHSLPDLTGSLNKNLTINDTHLDAMEHIIGYSLVPEDVRVLKVPDAVDTICKSNKNYVLVKRIASQQNKTVHPTRRLKPVKPKKRAASLTKSDESDASTEAYVPPNEEDTSETPKGSFRITVKSITNRKRCCCKFCKGSFSNAKQLAEHIQKNHRSMYCKDCGQGFTNYISYKRHLKCHGDKGHKCTICGKAFAFASQLQTHQTVHSAVRHKCTYGTCSKTFKNVGDLTRHLALHTAPKHQCPDCPYSHSDIRNFESHRLKHSQITKYVCSKCSQEFVFNTQYRRHLKDRKCAIKRSSFPDY